MLKKVVDIYLLYIISLLFDDNFVTLHTIKVDDMNLLV